MDRLLSESKVASYFEQGFLEVPGFFPHAELDELVRACVRVHARAQEMLRAGVVTASHRNPVVEGSRFTFEPAEASFALRHVAWCGNCEPTFDEFGRHPRMLALAAQIMGCSEMSQLINQVHYKDPGTPVAFDWHQDSQHRGMSKGQFRDTLGTGSYVQIAIAIDDVEADMGPLGFIPGSGRLGHLGPLYDAQSNWACNQLDPANAVFPLLKKGDAVAFGPYTVHGSKPNTGNRPRRTFINGFAAPGADLKKPSLPHEGRVLNAP